MDLEFNPSKDDQLWVVFRQRYRGEPCDDPTEGSIPERETGCELLGSKVAIIENATLDDPLVRLREDRRSWHFMRLVTSLAFADDEMFATVGEARTANWLDQAPDFMGPTLWSARLNIFAQDFHRDGSHLDMLHATPFGMGIAHQRHHVFWCFNGKLGSIDRYDFHKPHEPGGLDHTDGEYRRYVKGQVQRVEDIPSHLAFADDRETLFIADSGHNRIVKLDTRAEGEMLDIPTADPQIAEPKEVEGIRLEEVVRPGVMTLPSGIAVRGHLLFATDARTGWIYIFDLQGNEIRRIDTGLRDSLAGIAVGPDHRLYLADRAGGGVFRLESNRVEDGNRTQP